MAEVTLRDDVERGGVVEDVVVQGEITALSWSAFYFMGIKIRFDIPGDQVNAALLQASPAGLPDVGSSLGELIGRDLASPVGLDGLLDLTVST